MATTLSEIRTLVRRYIIDTGSLTWQNTELDSYINDGGRYLLSEMLKVNADYMLVRATATTVVAQEEYVVPSNMYSNKFRGLWVYSSSASSRYEIRHRSVDYIMAQQNLTGMPRSYTTLRNIYLLAPVPDSTYTLELWYTALPATLSADGDECTFNDEEVDVVALWASIRAKTARGLDLGKLPDLLKVAVAKVATDIVPDDNLSVEIIPMDMT